MKLSLPDGPFLSFPLVSVSHEQVCVCLLVEVSLIGMGCGSGRYGSRMRIAAHVIVRANAVTERLGDFPIFAHRRMMRCKG